MLIGALVLTSGMLEGRYDIHMYAVEAEGLNQDTRVVLQGLEIGRVKNVNPQLDRATNTLSFIATLSIRERFPDGTRLTLPAGTRALIAPPPTLVGPTLIHLVMPPPSRDTLFLQTGDTIASERRAGVLDALSEIAIDFRGQLDSTLAETRSLLRRTAHTVRETGALLTQARPQVDRVLARLDAGLGRTEDILAEVEPRVGPLSDSLVATLAATHQLLVELDSLTSLAQTMVQENRGAISQTLENLNRSAIVLQHFADQISRRPLRFLWGVTPPPNTVVPPDSSHQP